MQVKRRRVSPGSSRVVRGQALGREQYGWPLTSHFSFHSWKSRSDVSSVGFCIHWMTCKRHDILNQYLIILLYPAFTTVSLGIFELKSPSRLTKKIYIGCMVLKNRSMLLIFKNCSVFHIKEKLRNTYTVTLILVRSLLFVLLFLKPQDLRKKMYWP